MRRIAFVLGASSPDFMREDAVAACQICRSLCEDAAIYAEKRPPNYPAIILPLSQMPRLDDTDVLFFYCGWHSRLYEAIAAMTCIRVLVYAGSPLPRYFSAYSETAEHLAGEMREGICFLADKVDACMTPSGFCTEMLRKWNFTCPIVERPILLPPNHNGGEIDYDLYHKLTGDGEHKARFLCGETVAPYCRVERVIMAFALYQYYYDATAQLFVLGNCARYPRYYDRLRAYVTGLEVTGVCFVGEVTERERLTYYRASSVLINRSECVGYDPAFSTAFACDLPVIATDSGSAKEMMGERGIVLPFDSTDLEFALMARRVLTDAVLRRGMVDMGHSAGRRLAFDVARGKFVEGLKAIEGMRDSATR